MLMVDYFVNRTPVEDKKSSKIVFQPNQDFLADESPSSPVLSSFSVFAFGRGTACGDCAMVWDFFSYSRVAGNGWLSC
jgi:hypothetical protein